MPPPKDPIKYQEYINKLCIAKRGKNHPLYGTHQPDWWKKKISDATKGKKRTSEQCKRISEAKKGKPIWSKGRKFTEEHCKNISKGKKGYKPTKETIKKISESAKGKHHSEETKRKISESHKGDKCQNWRGGISFEPYCEKFNREFKERVRNFFGRVCIECGEPEIERRLCVHHVNFNKQSCCDNSTPLFVPLCTHCHNITQKDRVYWEKHFTNIINTYYEGRCYLYKGEK